MTTALDARAAASASYARAYDLHAEGEQIAIAEGRYDEAAEHHAAVLLMVRAYRNEGRTTPLEPLDICPCDECVRYVWRNRP